MIDNAGILRADYLRVNNEVISNINLNNYNNKYSLTTKEYVNSKMSPSNVHTVYNLISPLVYSSSEVNSNGIKYIDGITNFALYQPIEAEPIYIAEVNKVDTNYTINTLIKHNLEYGQQFIINDVYYYCGNLNKQTSTFNSRDNIYTITATPIKPIKLVYNYNHTIGKDANNDYSFNIDDGINYPVLTLTYDTIKKTGMLNINCYEIPEAVEGIIYDPATELTFNKYEYPTQKINNITYIFNIPAPIVNTSCIVCFDVKKADYSYTITGETQTQTQTFKIHPAENPTTPSDYSPSLPSISEVYEELKHKSVLSLASFNGNNLNLTPITTYKNQMITNIKWRLTSSASSSFVIK